MISETTTKRYQIYLAPRCPPVSHIWGKDYQQKGGKELLSKTDDEEATPEGELEAIATPAMEELAILSRMEAFMKEMWRLVELIAKIVTNLVSLEVQKVSGKHLPPCKGPSSDQVAILQPVTRVSAYHQQQSL